MNPNKLHTDIRTLACEGGLFDVEPCELDLDVGRFGRVRNPSKPGFGERHHERFEVVGVQKNYRGDVVYRVVFESDTRRFGATLHPDDALLEG